jgi:hypothetical protein
MRPPTANEIAVVRWFADRVEEPLRQSLLRDLEKASADEIREEQLTIRFAIEDYDPPAGGFQCPLPIHAAVADADGAILDVELLTDQNGRLAGLDVFRFDAGPIIGPDWPTLRVRRPDEAATILPGR